MLRHAILATALLVAVLVGRPSAQDTTAPASTSTILGTVTISQSVLAGGKPLAPGTYELRLTNESLTPLAGQTAGAERLIEFVSHGTVVAREAAIVNTPDDTAVGTTGTPGSRGSVRVEMLKGGEFLRVSVRHDGSRYLVHLPVAH